MYIMRRTQVYLEDELWSVLHVRARKEKTTVSELVRKAVRECYLGNLQRREAAIRAVVGIRRHRADNPSAVDEVRALRRGSRIDRFSRP
jgi:predicted DNA-binding ribbon-helix-helix protein